MVKNRSHSMEPPVSFSISGTRIACPKLPKKATVLGLNFGGSKGGPPVLYQVGWYISQGQSMKHVGIDLRVAPFTHGQLYVALSCCTSKSRIKVLLPPPAENKTVNIVYTDVLLPPQ